MLEVCKKLAYHNHLNSATCNRRPASRQERIGRRLKVVVWADRAMLPCLDAVRPLVYKPGVRRRAVDRN